MKRSYLNKKKWQGDKEVHTISSSAPRYQQAYPPPAPIYQITAPSPHHPAYRTLYPPLPVYHPSQQQYRPSNLIINTVRTVPRIIQVETEIGPRDIWLPFPNHCPKFSRRSVMPTWSLVYHPSPWQARCRRITIGMPAVHIIWMLLGIISKTIGL